MSEAKLSRVERIEQELAAARAKEIDRLNKKLDKITEGIEKAKATMDTAQAKIDALTKEEYSVVNELSGLGVTFNAPAAVTLTEETVDYDGDES